MKHLFLCLSVILSFSGYAQIAGPDTICPGTSPYYITQQEAITYVWADANVSVKPVVQYRKQLNTTQPSGANIINPTGIKIVCDSNKYLGFVLNSAGGMTRVNFGAGPQSMVVSFKYFAAGGLFTSARDIDIVKDPVTQNWHGFITTNTGLLRLDFGTSISNNFTIQDIPLPSTVNSLRHIVIKKQGNLWVGFATDPVNNQIVVLNFNLAPSNIPLIYTHSGSALQNPQCLALQQQNSSWYLFITNGQNLVKASFGSNLLSTPTFTNMGSFNGLLNNANYLTFLTGCNDLQLLVTTETRRFVQLDFNNDITSIPVAIDHGYYGLANTTITAFTPYSTYSNVSILTTSQANNSVFFYDIFNYPTTYSTINHYKNPHFNPYLNNPGKQGITLFCDQGLQSGSETICTSTFVRDYPNVTITYDDSVLTANGDVVYYQWLDEDQNVIKGANNKTYKPITSGDYYVFTMDKYGCQGLSNEYNFAATSVDEPGTNKNIEIYPNPSTGLVNLEINNTSGTTLIECYNLIGVCVYKSTATTRDKSQQTVIDLSNVPKGLYLIKVTPEDQQAIIDRIIIQ